MEKKKYKVDLYLYDLSNGMAKSMSKFLLGKTIDAIYHTGIVVYKTEYFFGGGILRGWPGVRFLNRKLLTENQFLLLKITVKLKSMRMNLRTIWH